MVSRDSLRAKRARGHTACRSRPKAASYRLASFSEFGFQDLPAALVLPRGPASKDSALGFGGKAPASEVHNDIVIIIIIICLSVQYPRGTRDLLFGVNSLPRLSSAQFVP